MKIRLGKILTESSLYVTNGKTEICLDDIQDNIIDVNAGDTITIFTKQVTKREVRNSLLLFPFHIISAIVRCILLNVEKDYVEKKIEPYTVQCKYIVTKEDIEHGIKIDCVPSKYRADIDKFFNTKIKVNDVVQDIEQKPNYLQGIKVLNSFYMDMGWLVIAISVLGIYCINFGIHQLRNSRGIIFIGLGLLLVIGILSAFIVKIISDKKMLKRMKTILKHGDEEKDNK